MSFSAIDSTPPVEGEASRAVEGVEGDDRGRNEGTRQREAPPDPRPRSTSAPLIAPRTNERVDFLGSTQSGKTTLACAFLGQIRRTPIVLADTKGDAVLNRFARSRGFYDSDRPVLPSAEHPRVIVHGPAEAAWWDPLFWAAFRVVGGVLIYIDELTHLATVWNDPNGRGLRSAYQSGASRGIGVWASTQRPSGVPAQAFSEADHLFCFRLSWPEDEDTVSRMLRLRGERFRSDALPRYGFAYRTHGMSEPVICRGDVPTV